MTSHNIIWATWVVDVQKYTIATIYRGTLRTLLTRVGMCHWTIYTSCKFELDYWYVLLLLS